MVVTVEPENLTVAVSSSLDLRDDTWGVAEVSTVLAARILRSLGTELVSTCTSWCGSDEFGCSEQLDRLETG